MTHETYPRELLHITAKPTPASAYAPDVHLPAVKFPHGNPPTMWTVEHPNGPNWGTDLDTMPPGGSAHFMDWLHQRIIEDQLLDHLAAIVKDRTPTQRGLILIHDPDGATLMESEFIPPGTIILSARDQPDLMVKVDPEHGGVTYYRQRNRA